MEYDAAPFSLLLRSAIVPYLLVILIWSTTPLTIAWSNDTFDPATSVALRMLSATLIGWLIVLLWRRQDRLHRHNLPLYLSAALGLFPNMSIVYWSAQFIPSGLISVLFASSPLVVGIASQFLLGEKVLDTRRVIALLLALGGLSVILLSQAQFGPESWKGISGILVCNVLFSLSTVLVKKYGGNSRPFEQTMGALSCALPGFVLVWLLAGQVPLEYSVKSVGAVSYLAIAGSLIGFFAYYQSILRYPMSLVALVPLITPVFAVWLGSWLNGETISKELLTGSALLLGALALYQGLPKRAQA